MFGVGTSRAGPRRVRIHVAVDRRRHDWSKARPVAGPVPSLERRPGARPADDRRRRRRAERPRAGAERGHRQRCADGRRRDNRIVMTYVSGDIARRTCSSPSRPMGATTGRPHGRSKARWIAASTPRHRFVRTARTSTSSTTRSRRRSNDDREPRSARRGHLARRPPARGPTGAFTEIHRGPPGDPRGIIQNGLPPSSSATTCTPGHPNVRYGGVERRAQRARIARPSTPIGRRSKTGRPQRQPQYVQPQCPATFGNSDIWAFTTAP